LKALIRILLTAFLFQALSGYSSAEDKSFCITSKKENIAISDSILNRVLILYNVPERGLLAETFPRNIENKVDYLAEGSDQQHGQEVSFLWPYSSVISGVVALFRETREHKYLDLLENHLLPGLEKYWDSDRNPAAYQSYPTFAGKSDRYYDDNDWIALDFCTLYETTHQQKYLQKARQLYDFIMSGKDDVLEGGVYWCEQKKHSKNTCSNAPTAVLCARLYEITHEKKYLDQAIEICGWTKQHLLDPSDNVYWDNVNLEGRISKQKYTYNTGQMIEAAVRLYKITKKKNYLHEAQLSAKGAYQFFVKEQETQDGKMLFYPDSPWFNVILLRGLNQLYAIDGNDVFIKTLEENAYYAFHHTLDENGLFGNSWYRKNNQPHKSLLDNACMIELFAELPDLK
jgi:uncharacterized protein YyaL (SSP411 family)